MKKYWYLSSRTYEPLINFPLFCLNNTYVLVFGHLSPQRFGPWIFWPSNLFAELASSMFWYLDLWALGYFGPHFFIFVMSKHHVWLIFFFWKSKLLVWHLDIWALRHWGLIFFFSFFFLLNGQISCMTLGHLCPQSCFFFNLFFFIVERFYSCELTAEVMWSFS